MAEIGDALRERRMALKIDVHEVEEATKIRAKYLRALENEEYELLPGPAYVKSFLRTYADYLDIDSRQLVDAYKDRHLPSDDDQTLFAARSGTSGDGMTGRRRLLIVAGVIVLILVILFVIGTIGGGSGGST